MNPNSLRIKKVGNFSTATAKVSFIAGTILFIGYYIFTIEACFWSGIIYVLLAIFVNSILLLVLAYHLVCYKDDRNYLTRKTFILLANIPIAAIYYYLTSIKFQDSLSF